MMQRVRHILLYAVVVAVLGAIAALALTYISQEKRSTSSLDVLPKVRPESQRIPIKDRPRISQLESKAESTTQPQEPRTIVYRLPTEHADNRRVMQNMACMDTKPCIEASLRWDLFVEEDQARQLSRLYSEMWQAFVEVVDVWERSLCGFEYATPADCTHLDMSQLYTAAEQLRSATSSPIASILSTGLVSLLRNTERYDPEAKLKVVLQSAHLLHDRHPYESAFVAQELGMALDLLARDGGPGPSQSEITMAINEIAQAPSPGSEPWALEYWSLLSERGTNTEMRIRALGMLQTVPCTGDGFDCPLGEIEQSPSTDPKHFVSLARCVAKHEITQPGQWELPSPSGFGGCATRAVGATNAQPAELRVVRY